MSGGGPQGTGTHVSSCYSIRAAKGCRRSTGSCQGGLAAEQEGPGSPGPGSYGTRRPVPVHFYGLPHFQVTCREACGPLVRPKALVFFIQFLTLFRMWIHPYQRLPAPEGPHCGRTSTTAEARRPLPPPCTRAPFSSPGGPTGRRVQSSGFVAILSFSTALLGT